MKFRLIIPVILLFLGVFLIFKSTHEKLYCEKPFFKIPDPTIGPGTIVQLLDYGTNMTFSKNFSFDMMYVYTSNVTFENYTSPIVFNSSFIYNNVSIELLEFDLSNENVTINCTNITNPDNYVYFYLNDNSTHQDYYKNTTCEYNGQIIPLLGAVVVNQPPYFWAYNQTKDNTTEYFNFTVNSTGPAWFWWNITDNNQVDFSTCQAKIRNWLRLSDQPLLRFINDSYDPRMDENGWIHYNCTFVEGYDNNKTIRVVIQLNHTYEYWSGVFPFEPSNATTYYQYVVHGRNYLMMVLNNVTTEPGTRYVISLWAERYDDTANTRDLNVYICNSSYTSGDPFYSPYCFLTHAINKFEQPNGENQFEYLLPFTSDENSSIDGVKVTSTMKIILRADTAQAQATGWKVYASNISSTHTYISSDSGDTWTLGQYEANIFLLMANLEKDQHFQINVSIADNEGVYNSTNVSIPWSNVNYPPDVTILLDDHPGDLLSIYLYNDTLNITESGLVWINASVYDPDFDSVNCSIYLLNMDMSLNKTLVENQQLNNYYGICHYLLDTNTIPRGTYYVRVNATDGNLTGFDTTDDYVKFAWRVESNVSNKINIYGNTSSGFGVNETGEQHIATTSYIKKATQLFIDKAQSLSSYVISIISSSFDIINKTIISLTESVSSVSYYLGVNAVRFNVSNRIYVISGYLNPYLLAVKLSDNIDSIFNPNQYDYAMIFVSAVSKSIQSVYSNIYQDIVVTPTRAFAMIYSEIPKSHIILYKNIERLLSFSEIPSSIIRISDLTKSIYSTISKTSQYIFVNYISKSASNMYRDVVSSVTLTPNVVANKILKFGVIQTLKENLYEITKYTPNIFVLQTLPTNVVSFVQSIRLLHEIVYQPIKTFIYSMFIYNIPLYQQINITTYNIAKAGSIEPYYKYYTTITIDNTNNTNSYSDYELPLILNTEKLISNNKLNSDCSDLRFYYVNSTDNSTYKIPYWLETGCGTNETMIWIDIPYIPANNTTTIIMYYGNPLATSESNFSAVFDTVYNITSSTTLSGDITGYDFVDINAPVTISGKVNITAPYIRINADINGVGTGYSGGQGPGAGGNGGCDTSDKTASGGGGAGFGGNGGNGGSTNLGPGGGSGGSSYYFDTDYLGSGGGGGGVCCYYCTCYASGKGKGGGSFVVNGIKTVMNSITIDVSGTSATRGSATGCGSGSYSTIAGSGGGSGGSVVIDSLYVYGTATIYAKGGNGASGYNDAGYYKYAAGGGGGGAGGRVLIKSFINNATFTVDVSGGAGGAGDSGSYSTAYGGGSGQQGTYELENNTSLSKPTYMLGSEAINEGYIGYLQIIYAPLKTAVNNIKSITNIFMSVLQTILAKLNSIITVERTKILIDVPKGDVYGYNEEINITLKITDSQFNPLPNRNFDFYLIYPNGTWNKIMTWYTDENGTRRITFTIGDTNPTGEYGLYFNTSIYSYNSTNISIINPINITDFTPEEWYIDSYGDSESTLTQLLNISINRPIINITFYPELPLSNLEPFYHKELNGGYTNCNDKTIGDFCYAVMRYLNLPEGTNSLDVNVTIYYSTGGVYSYTYTKNVSVLSTLTKIYNTKVKLYDSGSFSFTLSASGTSSCTDSDGVTHDYTYYNTPSNYETITLPDNYDYALVRVWTSPAKYSQLYYGTNTGSPSTYIYCDAGCGENCRASKFFVGRNGDLKNVTVKVRSTIYNGGTTATSYIYYEIYLFNDTSLRVIRDWSSDYYSYFDLPATLYTYTPNSTEYGAVYAENVQAYCRSSVDYRAYLYTYFNGIGIASYDGGLRDCKKSMDTTIKTVTINRNGENTVTIDNDAHDAGEGYYRQGYIFPLLRDLSITCISNASAPDNIRGDPYWHWGYYLMSDSIYQINCTITNNGLKNHEKGYFVIHAPPGYEFSENVFEIPPLNVGENATISFIMKTPTADIEPLRGFGRDTLWFFVNTTDGGYGHLTWWFRLLPNKDVDVILTAPDRVQAGSLFSIDVKFTPHKYSVFYPHIYMDLDGTMGIDIGYSTALLNRTGQGELVVGACFPTTLSNNAWYTRNGNSYPAVRNYLYMYDPYGLLGIPKGNNTYEIGTVSTGYGIIEPGNWGMFGVYDYKINNFVAETGSIFSDWDDIGRQLLYKRLDITEVWQAINIISGPDQPLPSQVVNDVSWTVVHYPLYIYVGSDGYLHAKTTPDENAVYFMPCLSNSWRVIDPPMNIYVQFIKTGEDAFTIPAGETLSKVDNQIVQPEETASGMKFKAIAPLKPGIYNITAIVYDDAETGLIWYTTKQIRVVSSLPEEKIVVSYKDEPFTEIEAKDVNNTSDILMKRIVYVTNHEGFDDVQVVWRMPPLPEDAEYINGSVEGVIDYLCNNCTVNPSNVTFKVPGISMWLDHIQYDNEYVDLEQNITGSIAIWVKNNATSTDFNNVKVNATIYLPQEAYSNSSVFYIDTIYHNQRLYYEIPFTVRTGEITYWNIEKPATTYKYTAKILMYNNASSTRPIRIHIPLYRLPEFNPSTIRTISVDGNTNVGYMVTSSELVVIVPSDFKDGHSLLSGEHTLYLEYFPYAVGPGPAPGGGVFVQKPTIMINPKIYNYTGRPGNITIWYEITCKEGCSIVLIPEGPYSSWIDIPRDFKYGWTQAGFIYIAPGQTIRQPIFVNMPDVADGYYSINITAYDIPTRAKATAKINIQIKRGLPIETLILIGILALLIAKMKA